MFVHYGLSPWVTLVDPDRYRKSVDQLQALCAKVIAGAHNPLITATDIPVALGIMPRSSHRGGAPATRPGRPGCHRRPRRSLTTWRRPGATNS